MIASRLVTIKEKDSLVIGGCLVMMFGDDEDDEKDEDKENDEKDEEG